MHERDRAEVVAARLRSYGWIADAVRLAGLREHPPALSVARALQGPMVIDVQAELIAWLHRSRKGATWSTRPWVVLYRGFTTEPHPTGWHLWIPA